MRKRMRGRTAARIARNALTLLAAIVAMGLLTTHPDPALAGSEDSQTGWKDDVLARMAESAAFSGAGEPGMDILAGVSTESAPVASGCNATTVTAADNTSQAIPDGSGSIVSHIAVSGADRWIWDVDVTTYITHTFNHDLQMILTSPQGTIVTLVSNQGGAFENVFNGTTWDDQADPGSQVPYAASNPNLVTDHIYTNQVVASHLVPEEALGAFIGENPNGTWYLRIVDDNAGHSGTLDGWSLRITSFPSAPPIRRVDFYNNVPVPISSGLPAVYTSTYTVSGMGNVLRRAIAQTWIEHTNNEDLDVTLTSPAGTVVTLTTDNALFWEDVFYGTEWRDDADPSGTIPYVFNDGVATDHPYISYQVATPLVPEEAMAAFNGEDPNGVWTLTISDDAAGEGGQLVRWRLGITTIDCCTLECPGNFTGGNNSGECGNYVGWPPPSASAGCGDVTCSPASGSFFDVGTTHVTCTAASGASCGFDITIEDRESPSLAITEPPEGSCAGGAVTVTFDSSDNCTNPPHVSFDPPGGPTYSGTGDHHVTVMVTDDAGLTAGDQVNFTIDTTRPVVQITQPAIDQLGLPPVTIPINVKFTSADDDGASGGVVHEVLKLEGCVLRDGLTFGDRDGLLSDEVIQINKYELCQAMSRCGYQILNYPRLVVETTDCAGNVTSAARIIRKRLLKTEVCF